VEVWNWRLPPSSPPVFITKQNYAVVTNYGNTRKFTAIDSIFVPYNLPRSNSNYPKCGNSFSDEFKNMRLENTFFSFINVCFDINRLYQFSIYFQTKA